MFGEDLGAKLRKIQLPFCGPISATWPEELKQYIARRFDGLIGTVMDTTNAEGIDGKVLFGDGRYALQLECKNYTKKLNSPRILEIVQNFLRQQFLVNVIVAREYVGLSSIAKYVKGNFSG